MLTRPIDEKLVVMSMDNSDFMNKATETTKAMGGLTKFLNKIPGINIGKTAHEFRDIQRSVNGIEMGRLSGALDTVTSRFSTLGIVGTTALMNITNRAVDAGMSILRNLTVKPVMDGFEEYELKMGSIQTILANTARHGTNLEDVKEALEELNLYADKTVYNFGQMTRNIGLFTNAGLKLGESTSMIKGFANAAAASGAGAMEMARAAYQLSQGLATGYLMQMDWMSLTNAGMGNDNMKRDLIALGQAMGTLNRTTEDTVANWKEVLSDDRWLTKEVFSTYLQAMAGDIDKATLLTVGLTEAQADLLIQNAKIGEESATYVRTFTQMMGTLVEGVGSGWSESWQIIFGDFEQATKLWTGFSELIAEPFNALTASRNNFLNILKEKGVFEEIFVNLGTAIHVVGQAITVMAGGFDKAFSSDRIGIVESMVKGFGRFVSSMTPSQETLTKIGTIFQAIGSNVRVVMKLIGDLGSLFFKLIPDNLGTNLLSMLESFAKINISFNESILKGDGLRAVFENLGEVFSWIGARLDYVGNGFAKLGNAMLEMWTILSTGEASTEGMFEKDSKVVVWLVAISEACKTLVERITSIKLTLAPITGAFTTFFSMLVTGFNWVKGKLSGIGQAIQDNMPSGTTLFAGGFVAALIAITGIVSKRIWDITKIFGQWGNIIEGFADTLESVSGALDAFALNLKANALLTASIAVAALAVSILLLSRINGAQVSNSLIAIVGSLTAVIGAMAIMNKFDVTGGVRVTASIVGMAVALSIMSIALKQFGDLNPYQLTAGLIGLSTAMMGLALSFALMGKYDAKGAGSSALQIVAMGAAVFLMAKAVKEMATLNQDQLIQGLSALGTILVGVAGAFALMGKYSGKGAASSMQLVAMAGSILVLVGAIKLISLIEWQDLAIGLGTITAILGVVAGFAALTSGKGLASSAVGLLAMSVAINAMLIPIFALGNFPLDKLGIGLLGVTTALLAIAAAATFMRGAITGAASVMAMAIALNFLIVPITAFSLMGWGPMLTGIAGVALSLAALAAVSLLLTPATIPLLAFSGAIALMGVAMLAVGAGMTLFSTGLLTLAGMTSAAVTVIITTIGALIVGMSSLIPSAVRFVIDIITEIAIAIRDNAPKVVGILSETIVGILVMIASYIPEFVKATVKIMTTFLDAIAEEGPKVIDSMVNLLVTLVEKMATTVEENGPRFVNAFLGLIGQILKLMVDTGTSVITALYGWIPGVEGAMDKIANTAKTTIDERLDAAKLGEEKGEDFSKGIGRKHVQAMSAGEEISKSADKGLKSVNSEKTGGNFITRFIDGLMGRRKEVEDASVLLASAADDSMRDRLGVHSLGLEGMDTGSWHGKGFAAGLDSSTDDVQKSTDGMTNVVMSGLSGIKEMVRDKLFLSDKDVKENKAKTDEVAESYSGVSKEIEGNAKTQQKSVKSTQKTLDEAFKQSKEWIEEQKYYLRMSLEQELEAWERLQERYKEGTEERRQADREVFRVQQEMIKAKRDAEKEAFNHSKGFIEDEKTFKKISLLEELADWERVQARYEEGSEERKSSDREILRIKNEINQQLIELNNDYVKNVKDTNDELIEEEQRLNEEYLKTYDDRVRDLTNFVGLFSKVKVADPEKPLTGYELVENLRGQVNTMATWSDDLQRLAQKGIDDGLLKELEQMGPSAALEIAALNQLTSAQLDQYVELWQKKNELARKQATKELEPLREETNRSIEELRKDTAKQLDAYKTEWLKKIGEIKYGTRDNFVELNADMNEIGANAIEALGKGMEDEKSPLYTKVREIARGIESAIKEVLKIQSPSKVMMGIGKFVGEGLAIGLEDSSGMVGDKSKSLAEKARESINKFLSTFQMPEFNNEIHFKAILDDSELLNGTKELNNTETPWFLRTTNGLVSSAKAVMRQNGNNGSRTDDMRNQGNGSSGSESGRPIVIQSILNGRVIAEETFNDMNHLMAGRTNLDYLVKGV